ncbi:hypothetical protein ACF08W_28755 [Streptomyces sp. NPDC015144]|uniref:hypothetical protein n=1 Tax=Streptomyces sp. NPDC015144 TaxID=3364944 RepID=UPI0036FFEFEB
MSGFTVGESSGIAGVPMLSAAKPITSYTLRTPDEAARAFWDAAQRLAPESFGTPW